MSTLFIDSMKQHDVAVFNVPGAYLHIEMTSGKHILLCIRDEFLGIVCEFKPDYITYFQCKNGKKLLYVKVLIEI